MMNPRNDILSPQYAQPATAPLLYFVEADYSQLEARILALLSGDPLLLQWFAANEDVHTLTARVLFPDFDIPPSRHPEESPEKYEERIAKNKKKKRELAKRARYALHYGSKPSTAYSALVVDFPTLSLSAVHSLWATFAKLHPRLIAYQSEQLSLAYSRDFVEAPISGRRHHFHGHIEPAKVYNLPIQMSSTDIINPAMIRLSKRLEENETIRAQIHDSLLCCGPNPPSLGSRMKEEMERPIHLNGNSSIFPVDLSYGNNWGEMKKLDL